MSVGFPVPTLDHDLPSSRQTILKSADLPSLTVIVSPIKPRLSNKADPPPSRSDFGVGVRGRMRLAKDCAERINKQNKQRSYCSI
jgi:hypothetical protein